MVLGTLFFLWLGEFVFQRLLLLSVSPWRAERAPPVSVELWECFAQQRAQHFSYRTGSAHADCQALRSPRTWTMHASSPLQLLPEDKIDALRKVDEFRFWYSLDDARRCARCKQTITGKQILVFELKGTRGRLRLQCPTVGCVSTPSEWTYADPVLAAKRKYTVGQRRLDAKNQGGDVQFRYQPSVTGRRKIPSRQKTRSSALHRMLSLRPAAAWLPILRPLATRFHAFHPVA